MHRHPLAFRRRLLLTGAAALLTVNHAPAALAQEVVKVGVIAELSGTFSNFGKQMQAGIQVYQKEFGDTVAGKKVEVIYKDVGGANPEVAKRLAQDLIVSDKVQILAGFGFTPNALAVAPIATQAKVPMVVMNAAASGITSKSPFMVRTSFGYDTMVPPIARWAVRNGMKKAYVLVADYAPGHDAEAAFVTAFKAAGGEVIGSVHTPVVTLDFSPYLQRVKDAKPDVLFAFVNGGDVGPAFYKEYREKGLADAGIKLIGSGDIADDSDLSVVGLRALDVVTVFPYSIGHKSPLNARYVADYHAVRDAQTTPSLMSVSAYDGMAAIYAALNKTHGNADGQALMDAFSGLQIESPRGPITIDAKTHDVVQDQYIRRVVRSGDGVANVEIETIKAAAHQEPSR